MAQVLEILTPDRDCQEVQIAKNLPPTCWQRISDLAGDVLKISAEAIISMNDELEGESQYMHPRLKGLLIELNTTTEVIYPLVQAGPKSIEGKSRVIAVKPGNGVCYRAHTVTATPPTEITTNNGTRRGISVHWEDQSRCQTYQLADLLNPCIIDGITNTGYYYYTVLAGGIPLYATGCEWPALLASHLGELLYGAEPQFILNEQDPQRIIKMQELFQNAYRI